MATVFNEIPLGNVSGSLHNGRTSAQTTLGHATPRVVVSPDPHEAVGSWLCSPGPYREYIAALSSSNPGLKSPDPNNADNPLTDGGAHIVMLELDVPATGQPRFIKTEFRNAGHLRQHLQVSSRNHDRRRIYIMEGLAKDYVAAIGDHFYMDPGFWLRQERTCVWSNDFTPLSDALPQPSLLNPEQSFHLQYCELREFNKALEFRPCFCKRTRRHVGMTAPRHAKNSAQDGGKPKPRDKNKDNTTTAILRRKVSWWSEETENGGWDVIILCDPQLAQLDVYPKEKVNKDEKTGEYELKAIENPEISLENEPFQGGYIDFIPPRRLEPGKLPNSTLHPHKSMLEDLVYYYDTAFDLLSEEEWKSPSKSSIFLKKIVAAHYLQLADYIKVMLPSLELRLTTAWVEEREQWKQLGTISRRCGNYRDDIEDTLLSLGFPLDIDPNDLLKKKDRESWKDCKIDYQYAYLRLKVLKERADNLMTSMTGLASIAGNRQNLEEAKRVKRLNLLALLFIPLAYTSSLFSMQDEYAPNKPQFWVYWVCAIGVVMFTSVVTWVLDRALNDAAEWTLESFKPLNILGKQDAKPTLTRAKGTSVWGKG